MAAGIGMVHQHFMLVDVFTVAENLILGREHATAGVLTCAQRGRPSGSCRSGTGWRWTPTR